MCTESSDIVFPPVTLLIPVRNEQKHIGRMLSEVLNQDYPADITEVIVIDGASNDETVRIATSVAGDHPKRSIRILRNDRRIVPISLNMGLREASGDVVLRLDAHTEYASDYVRSCVRTLIATGADNVGGPVRTRSESFLQRAIAAAFHSPFSAGGARFHDVEARGDVDTVPYGCWWRKKLLDLGGFDEELVRNQDDELNLRIIRTGGRVWIDPSIQSWYHPRASLRSLFRQYMQYGYWKVRVIRKHRMPASVRHLVPAVFVLGVLVGGLLSAFSAPLRTMYFGTLIAYAFLVLGFSVNAARKEGMKLFPVLLVVFPIFHLSYGLGFLSASIRELLLGGRGRQNLSSTLFTTLSR